jgi:glucokinase
VGGGVVTDGMTFRGAHGLGAELGHMTINPDGPPCPGNCPNRGCLEAYCSGQALERDATELARDRPDSALAGRAGEDRRLSARELVAAAEDGDRDALLLMDNFARMLGIGIANYVNIFEPSRLAIGGGLSRASHLFLARAIREAGARALPALWNRVSVELAEGGPDAGVIGAGLLAALELRRDRDTDRSKATTTEGTE